ncbi:MAG: phosphoenolpyruvate synthase [bacterium JZ-2024 1]
MKRIVWIDQADADSVSLVGGKNASLGEMKQKLAPYGIKIPEAFFVTTEAYEEFLEVHNLRPKIAEALQRCDSGDVENLRMCATKARNFILGAPLPSELKREISEAYQRLCDIYQMEVDVAVRSSATAEDLSIASFAGQQDTFLNIRGTEAIAEAVKRCFASLFNERAISYRIDHHFGHEDIRISAGVQKMVRADLGSSGVIFTLDPETGFRNVIYLTSVFGLGEVLVRGLVTPDEFYIFKPLLEKGFPAIVDKHLGAKKLKMTYRALAGEQTTKVVKTTPEERKKFSLTDEEVLQLSRWALQIEKHFSGRAGAWVPMDIEWAKDGILGELFILQARPETIHSQRTEPVHQIYRLKQKGKVLVQGQAVGSKISTGNARILGDVSQMHLFQAGEILVTDMTDPDWEPIMRKASGIITERGGRTCHAAIVSRELGIPAIVGAAHARERIASGSPITVSCAEGEIGFVYEGKLPYETETLDLRTLPQTRTALMLNVGNPEKAFEYSRLPHKGVGLARLEFIIASDIQIHPLALLRFDRIPSDETKRLIAQLTEAYPDRTQFFVEKLAQGIAKIASAFYPYPVILRFSDFKTNEYANLIGGKFFEPVEENPMLGFRGASRYYSEFYRDAFALECLAVDRVRRIMGLCNLKVMIPFCRTPQEGVRILEILENFGLCRGKEDFEVYVMAEIPSNILLADEFAQIFDGFSIGSNDLTQLTLGVDRDSSSVAFLYDERNPAVLKSLEHLIHTAHRYGKKVGICGQAPSDFPEFVRFLVLNGIDSISLNPDALVPTLLQVYELEQTMSQTS